MSMTEKLKLPKSEALNMINQQIEIAKKNIKEFYTKEEIYDDPYGPLPLPFNMQKEKEKFIEDEKSWAYKTKKIINKIFPRKEEIKHFESAKAYCEYWREKGLWFFKKDYEKKLSALESIKGFLDSYDEPDAIPSKIAPKIERKFNFVKDKSLKEIIERDYQELIASVHNKSVKSILIISGSILEAILLDKVLTNKYKIGKSEKKILEMNLHELKNSLSEIDIVIKEADVILTYIKHHRNIIHPGKEKLGDFKISEKDALAVFHNLEAIIDKIANN